MQMQTVNLAKREEGFRPRLLRISASPRSPYDGTRNWKSYRSLWSLTSGSEATNEINALQIVDWLRGFVRGGIKQEGQQEKWRRSCFAQSKACSEWQPVSWQQRLRSLTGINQQSAASMVLKAMWPIKNAVMREGKGRDKNIITPGTITWECAPASLHLFLTVRPRAPQANSVFRSVLQSPAGLTQARASESESNYRHNYDCDPVWPGFVFKWTHLPWASEVHLLRTECEPPDSVAQPLSLYYSTHRCGTCSHNAHNSQWCTCLFFSWMHQSSAFPLNSLNSFIQAEGLH